MFGKIDLIEQLSQFGEVQVVKRQEGHISACFSFTDGIVGPNRIYRLVISCLIEFLVNAIMNIKFAEREATVHYAVDFQPHAMFTHMLHISVNKFRDDNDIISFVFDIKNGNKQVISRGVYELMLTE